jgi:hypothetical protein
MIGATSASPSVRAMRSVVWVSTYLCSPVTMCGPFCSCPAVPMMMVLVPAFCRSRTSVHVSCSRKTGVAAGCASTRSASVTANSATAKRRMDCVSGRVGAHKLSLARRWRHGGMGGRARRTPIWEDAEELRTALSQRRGGAEAPFGRCGAFPRSFFFGELPQPVRHEPLRPLRLCDKAVAVAVPRVPPRASRSDVWLKPLPTLQRARAWRTQRNNEQLCRRDAEAQRRPSAGAEHSHVLSFLGTATACPSRASAPPASLR